MEERGFVQVYTGDGKGKTTAAIGLAIRALGAGKKVLLLQFMKGKVYSEHKILADLSPNLTLVTTGKPFFVAEEGMLTEEQLAQWGEEVVVFAPGNPPAEYVELMAAALTKAQTAAEQGLYDLIILDEVNVALFFGLVKDEQVQRLIRRRVWSTELVCTGRNAPDWLIDAADLVTDMREVKHYYQQGIDARLGIEN